MSNNTINGINVAWLLTSLFIGLKLSGNIDWSWLWVLCPLWVLLALVVCALLAIGGVFALILAGVAIWAYMEDR